MKPKIIKNCATCGNTVVRTPATDYLNVFCCRPCFFQWNSKRFTKENPNWNKTKMTTEVKTKLRESKLGKGDGKSYTKVFGRHEHRVVAEQILGRPLKKGEVVHHIDENKRNNNPDNLRVFASQAEHAAHHKKLIKL